jgi:cbb3-type cytochrome c oxidase subunit III
VRAAWRRPSPHAPRTRTKPLLAAAVGVALAFLLAACGTGGPVASGSAQNGLKVFQEECGGCHTLAAAQTQSTVGPNLDAAFAEARSEGFEESSIRDIVAGQIRAPGQYPTGDTANTLQANMPANLIEGQDLADVAEFVAANAGKNGFVEPVAVSGTNGAAIFKAKCGSCHTLAAAGTKGTVGPNLDQLKPPLATVRRQVINGGGAMPAFKSILNDAQINAVARYVAQNAGK